MLFRFRSGGLAQDLAPLQILCSWVNFLPITSIQRCQEQAPGKLCSSGQAAKTTWTPNTNFCIAWGRSVNSFEGPIKSWDSMLQEKTVWPRCQAVRTDPEMSRLEAGGEIAYLWKSSMQWMRPPASTVNGIPSRLRWHITQVKQWGW